MDCVLFDRKDSYGTSRVAKLTLKVKHNEVLRPFPIAPNRGFFAALELAISLSRGETNVKKNIEVIKKTLPPAESKRIEIFVQDYLSKP
jgi:hypothetical protein